MKVLNQYIILLIILLAARLGYTQPTGGSVNVPSPTASNLGTYTDIPISHYTGTPDVSIPITVAQEGNLSAPVSLSYHPANLVLGIPASNVGKGWSLNAGGVISRIVQDQPDDDKEDGELFRWPIDLDNGSNHTTALREKDLEPDIFSFNVDGLSGKFYFDEGSGSPYAGLGRLVAKTIPKSDILIEAIVDIAIVGTPPYVTVVGTGNIKGFKLTNTDGTIYYFGKYNGREAVEKSTLESNKYVYNEDGDLVRDGNDVESQTVTNSWYLLHKEDHNKDNSIDYYYENEKYVFRTLANNQVEYKNYDREEGIQDDSRNNNGVMLGETVSRNVLTNEYSSTTPGFSNSKPYLGKYHNYRDNIVDGVRITKIETDLDLIEFKYRWHRQDLTSLVGASNSLTAKTLDTIVVRTNDNNGTLTLDRNYVCKKFVFDYEYYEDKKLVTEQGNAFISSTKKTLFLKGLKQKSCDGAVEENPFEFDYHTPETNTNNTKFFPSRLNKAIDHFGYYNGADGSYSSAKNNNTKELNIPYTSIKFYDKKDNGFIYKSKGNAERNPNETYSKYGVLEKITYPTGGTAEYEYENHRYSYDKINSYDIKFELEGCDGDNTYHNCCEQYTRTHNYTFNSIQELQNAYYVFNLSVGGDFIEPTPVGGSPYTYDPSEPCSGETVRQARMKLTVREVGATGPSAIQLTKEVNIEGMQYHYDSYTLPVAAFDADLDDFVGRGLRPDVDYVFTVEFQGGIGTFQLVTPNVTVQPNQLGCGLRIKSTKLSDGIEETDNDIIKNYSYNVGNSSESSGVLFAHPKYAVKVEHYDYAQVKTGNNPYVTYNGHTSHSLPGGDVYYQRILFSENSFMPLYGFDGVHIGYKEVKETTLPSNGVSIFKFKANRKVEQEITNTMPILPFQLDIENGQMRKSEIKNEDGDLISETNFKAWDYPLNNVEKSRKIMKVHDVFSYEKGSFATSHDINLIVLKEYEISRAYYQLEEVVTTTEGVSMTTKYEYDQLNPHLAPKATIETNSDGTQKKEEFYYAYEEISNQIILDSIFRKRNLLNAPIKSEIHIIKNGDKTRVSGKKIKYSLFNSIGNPISENNLPASGFDNYGFYPYVNYSYLGNLNQADDFTGNWLPTDTSLKYNQNGQVVESRYVGWDKTSYTYDNKLLSGSNFLNQNKEIEYYSNTRLIKRQIDIDGKISEYNYDQFGRLLNSYTNNNNVISTIEYGNYDKITGDLAYTKTSFNYTPTSGSQVSNKSVIEYYDGLGRVISEIGINSNSNGNDLVTIKHYDSLGRLYKETEAFEGENNGEFTWGPINTPDEKYTITQFDNSPLSRVVSAKHSDWYPIFTEYEVNTAQDQVKNWADGSFYSDGTLSKIINITNEGDKTITFTDKFGKVVLARKTNSDETKKSDTYYLYDIKGRLTKILPPETMPSDNDLIFINTYDGRGNKIAYKKPDRSEVISVYNEKGQQVAKQDNQFRNQSKWYVNEFDEYGRIIRTGTIAALGGNKPSANNLLIQDVWSDIYYGTSGIEKNKILSKSVAIFDGYTILPNTINYNYNYDVYGRIKKTSVTNHLGGLTETQSNYDFVGNIVSSTTVHQKDLLSSSVTIENTYNLDHQGRVLSEYKSINGSSSMLIANYSYDSLGRTAVTNLGGVSSNPLQSIDFSYDAAGHVSGINTNPTANDLFSIQIGYDNGLGVANANTYTDGKIGIIRWKHKNSAYWQNYSYEYDYLGQLTKANYSEKNGIHNVGDYNTSYTYDARGNFKKVKRNGVYKTVGGVFTSTQIDNLTYSYYSNSNRLKKVTDYTLPVRIASSSTRIPTGSRGGGSTSATGISNGNPVIGDVQMKGYHPESTSGYYQYDDNGNTTYDPSRKIDIAYNYFDLPFQITPRGKNKTLKFLYDAEGNKIQKKLIENNNVVSKTDYIGSFYYENGVQVMNMSHGKIKNLNTIPVFDFQINDHLGNTRVVFSDRNNDNIIDVTEVLQINNMYPYGMSMYGSWTIHNDTIATADQNHFLYNGMERVADLDLGLDITRYRTYDPTLGRWLQPDPKATLMPGFNPYNSMVNNPVSFNDPNGDIAPAVLIGIGIAVASAIRSGINAQKAGKSFLSGFGKSIAISAASSIMSAGIGVAFGEVGNKVAHELARAVAHGVAGGAVSLLQGGSFKSGFFSGAVSSIGGSITKNMDKAVQRYAIAGIAGGTSSLISGGNFFSGAAQGIIVQALNHEAHRDEDGGTDPPGCGTACSEDDGLSAYMITGEERHILAPDAILITGGYSVAAGIQQGSEGGWLIIFRGDEAGTIDAVGDIAVGGGLLNADASVKLTKLYYAGPVEDISADTFKGVRTEAGIGAGEVVVVGVSASRSSYNGNLVLGQSVSIGLGASATVVDFYINRGVTGDREHLRRDLKGALGF